MTVKMAEGERFNRYTITLDDLKEAFGVVGSEITFARAGWNGMERTLSVEVKE